MKYQELTDKIKGELEEMLKERKAELIKLRFGGYLRQLKNYARIKEAKKEIAKILTRLNNLKEKDE